MPHGSGRTLAGVQVTPSLLRTIVRLSPLSPVTMYTPSSSGKYSIDRVFMLMSSGPPATQVAPRSSEIRVSLLLATKRPAPKATSAKVGVSVITTSKLLASSLRTSVPGLPQPHVNTNTPSPHAMPRAARASWSQSRSFSKHRTVSSSERFWIHVLPSSQEIVVRP